MNQDPPEWSDAEVRLAIERFNEAGPPALAGNGYRLNPRALFRLRRLVHVDSRVLAVGELEVSAEGGTNGTRPLVLAWRFGPDQTVSDIETFPSEADAVSAIEGTGHSPAAS